MASEAVATLDDQARYLPFETEASQGHWPMLQRPGLSVLPAWGAIVTASYTSERTIVLDLDDRAGAQSYEDFVEVETVPMVLRKGVSRQQLAKEAADFVRDNPGSDAFDICEALRIPFSLAEEIADQLVDSGELRKGTDE